MRVSIILGVLALLLVQSASAQLQRQKRWKVGLMRFNSSVDYKYATQGKSSEDAETIDNDISKSSSGSIGTTDLMIEYIFVGRLGLEFNFSVTPGTRNFSFEDDNGTNIGDIVETTSDIPLFGLNLYSSDHSAPGFKFFFGVLTGTFQVVHEFSNGGDRSDDEEDELTLFKSSQTSSISVPAQIFKFGFDWVLDTVGLRMQMVSISSEVKTSSALPKTGLGQKQEETVALTGGLSIGVFGHF